MDMVKEDALISVIIPVFNVKRYLRQCLDSVVNQTYRNMEVLVIDDGSTDGSGEICDEYSRRDHRITVFHTDNRGLSAARNYALDRITGDYLAFLDSDDWLELDAYEKLVKTALITNADIVACRFYEVYTNKTTKSLGSNNRYILEKGEIVKKLLFEQGISNVAWNKLYRSEVFDSIRYPEGRVFEDLSTTYLILQKSKILAYSPRCLIFHRNRKNSLSSNHTMKNLVDYWLACYERFLSLSTISDTFYQILSAECVVSICRTWRWYCGCSENERKKALKYINDMQRFYNIHSRDMPFNRYCPKYAWVICRYAKDLKPSRLKMLYLMSVIYRRLDKKQYFVG